MKKQLTIFDAEAMESRPPKAKEQGQGKYFVLGLANDETKDFTTASGKICTVECKHKFIQGVGKDKVLYYVIHFEGAKHQPFTKVGVLNFLNRN